MRTGGMEDAKIMLVHGVPTAMQILAVFLCALPLLPQDDAALTPKLNECRLVVGAKETAPLGAAAGILAETTQGSWHLRFSKGFVEIATSGADRAPVKLGLPGEDFVEFPGTGSRTYFVDIEHGGNRVEVLDLEKGTWAAHWVLDDEWLGLEKKEGTEQQIVQILADDHALYVLREEFGAASDRHVQKSRVVARLEPELGKLTWARRLPCAVDSREPGAVLLAPMRSGPMAGATAGLALADHDLLLAFAGDERVMLWRAGNAEQAWSIERLWEFSRGYIGPSVWQHTFGRFGEGPFMSASVDVAERRAAFEKVFRGSVVAGPFPIRGTSRGNGRSRLIAITALEPVADGFGEYCAQFFAYEIDELGEPCAAVALPRGVLGWTACSDGDHVVAACDHGAWISIGSASSPDDIGGGFPGSGPDRVGQVRWYREPVPAQHAAWMECDPAGDPISLDARLGVRCAGGGRIEKPGERLFHFPLWLVDPRDGGVREVDLRVPFEGEMSAPTTNYQSDGKTMHTWGARGLGLTRLQLDGDRLLVWLANSKQVWKLEFDAREFVPAK